MKAPASLPPGNRAIQQSKPLLVREACFEDYPQISALHARQGIASKSQEEWVTQWSSNPAYDGQPIGWVIETAGRGIVGSVANFASAYTFQRRTLRAAVAGDWAVDPDYRGYSLQLIARLAGQEGADLVLTTTASARAEAVFEAFGWRRAPVGRWDRDAFWITNYRGFAKAALTASSVPLASVLSYPAVPALRLLSWLKTRRIRTTPRPGAVESCSGFDSRFDAFWADISAQNDGVLLGVRTRQALAWHFRNATPGENCWVLTARNGDRMTSYAIFDYRSQARTRLKRARIIDFQALSGYEHQIGDFLDWMLLRCRDLGIHVLENLGCWLLRPGIPRVSTPFIRKLSSWSFFYTVRDPMLAAALENPSVWAPSSLDGDVAI